MQVLSSFRKKTRRKKSHEISRILTFILVRFVSAALISYKTGNFYTNSSFCTPLRPDNIKYEFKNTTQNAYHPFRTPKTEQNCPPPAPAWCKATVLYRKISPHCCCTTAEFVVCVSVAI